MSVKSPQMLFKNYTKKYLFLIILIYSILQKWALWVNEVE